jgi:hypothetical protein
MSRSCIDGPVFRGEQVRWDDVGTIPFDAFGAPGWEPRSRRAAGDSAGPPADGPNGQPRVSGQVGSRQVDTGQAGSGQAGSGLGPGRPGDPHGRAANPQSRPANQPGRAADQQGRAADQQGRTAEPRRRRSGRHGNAG